jgi:exportin-T
MDESLFQGLSEDCSPLERARTLQYFEQLNSSPEGWKLCAAYFSSNTESSEHVQFFCLRVVEGHVKNRHAWSSDDNILALRSILLSWMQGSVGRNPLVTKKMAQIIALTFVIDYPQRWPMFFSEMLQCVSSGVTAAIHLYLRVLMAIDEEVVDRQIIHTREENARNTLIKDTMRDQCVSDLVESWYQIIVSVSTCAMHSVLLTLSVHAHRRLQHFGLYLSVCLSVCLLLVSCHHVHCRQY